MQKYAYVDGGTEFSFQDFLVSGKFFVTTELSSNAMIGFIC